VHKKASIFQGLERIWKW